MLYVICVAKTCCYNSKLLFCSVSQSTATLYKMKDRKKEQWSAIDGQSFNPWKELVYFSVIPVVSHKAAFYINGYQRGYQSYLAVHK